MALVVFYVLIVAGVLIASSQLENGQGLLGLSEPWSVAIAAGVIVTLIVLATRFLVGAANQASPAKTPRQKKDLSQDEWFALLEEAKHEVYIAGHSMGYWCDKSSRARFRSNLQRVLANGGEVTLVMLDLASPLIGPLREATERDYRRRIRESQPVLEDLRRSLDCEEERRLRIKTVADHVGLPYTVVGNERRLLTATYLARSDSNAMPCLELERDSEEGRAIYDDFHKIAGGERTGSADGSRLLSRLRRSG